MSSLPGTKMNSLSSLSYWHPVSFTECPLDLIHTAGTGEWALHSAYPPPHDFEILDYIPFSLPLPKCSIPAFLVFLDHLSDCYYLFPNFITPFWRCSYTSCITWYSVWRLSMGFYSAKMTLFVLFSINCFMMPKICLVFLAAAAHWADDFED